MRAISLALLGLALLASGLAIVGSRADANASQSLTITYSEASASLPDGTVLSIDVAHTGTRGQALSALAAHFPHGTVIGDPYTLLGFERQSPVTMTYNPAGKPPSFATDIPETLGGLLGWNTITPAFQYIYGGLTATSHSLCAGNGTNGQNTIRWLPQSGSILAVACTSGVGGVIESDIAVDPDWPWGAGADYQSVMLHEAGHSAGLGHSLDPAAVMYASYTFGTFKRTPTADDRAGICAIYDCLATATPTPPTPTATGTATPTSTATATMTPTPRNPCKADKPHCRFAPNVARD